MEISEVRVKLIENKDDRLKAFCSVTMDNEFVVRDIKIIEGSQRVLCGDAFKEDERPLREVRREEPSAGEVLQQLRSGVAGGQGEEGYEGQDEAARRHRTPD